tara:strand:+ start:423 stop:893 length:471 start_codon:yes stop_codon:yes gene_type:complete
MTLCGFKESYVAPFTFNQRKAVVSEALDRVFTDCGLTALDPDMEEEGTERYDEDRDVYEMSYPDYVETTRMMPAIVTVFLANNQIPNWHQTLIAHGFNLMVEGATNSKSAGGVINMYVGETPTSREYGYTVGNNTTKMATPLSGWSRVPQHEKGPS